jgi:integrase
MAPFKRSDKKEWYVIIPRPGQRWLPRSTGTTRRSVADRIDGALKELHPKEGNGLDELLAAVTDGRVALSELAKDPRISALKQLQKSLQETNLEVVQELWHARVAADHTLDTANHYRTAVKSYKLFLNDYSTGEARTLRPIRLADLTVIGLQKWADQLGGERNTKRKYCAGMSSFCQYLVRQGVLELNPMRGVELPALGPPRDHHLDTAEAEVLVKHLTGAHRALGALMAGSGIETSVALALTARDVRPAVREIRARGTKTHNRDRVVRVADWAWPYFAKVLEGKKPDEDVFSAIEDRWKARRVHAEACKKLVDRGLTIYDGYTLRDHRHTYAVRAISAGTPIPVVAKQLGHRDGQLVLKVYANYIPGEAERGRWEAVATAMDAAKKTAKKASFSVQGSVRTPSPRKKKPI